LSILARIKYYAALCAKPLLNFPYDKMAAAG